jgi:SAM-dependent methyltransferase
VRDALRTAKRRVLMLVYRGRAVECPCCGGRWRRFMPSWNRPNAICPGCAAQERHRALWLFLRERRPELFLDEMSLLHFAPEPAFAQLFRARPNLAYTSADLSSPDADEHFDITAIPHPDGSFDSIICSHVLEHVEDDRAAIAELHRVLRPGGWAIVMVPSDPARETTYEDPSVVSEADRKREFWQEDHVRLYGRDFPDRLREAGFDVELDGYLTALDPALLSRYGASAAAIPLCTKRPSRGA